jgi:hypothetical protein
MLCSVVVCYGLLCCFVLCYALCCRARGSALEARQELIFFSRLRIERQPRNATAKAILQRRLRLRLGRGLAGGGQRQEGRENTFGWTMRRPSFLPSFLTLRRDGLGACEAEESKESSEAVCSDLYCENALMAAMTTYTLTVAAAAARYYRQLATTLAILYRVMTYCVPIVAQTSRQTRHAGHHTPALDINAGEQTIPDGPTD